MTVHQLWTQGQHGWLPPGHQSPRAGTPLSAHQGLWPGSLPWMEPRTGWPRLDAVRGPGLWVPREPIRSRVLTLDVQDQGLHTSTGAWTAPAHGRRTSTAWPLAPLYMAWLCFASEDPLPPATECRRSLLSDDAVTSEDHPWNSLRGSGEWPGVSKPSKLTNTETHKQQALAWGLHPRTNIPGASGDAERSGVLRLWQPLYLPVLWASLPLPTTRREARGLLGLTQNVPCLCLPGGSDDPWATHAP